MNLSIKLKNMIEVYVKSVLITCTLVIFIVQSIYIKLSIIDVLKKDVLVIKVYVHVQIQKLHFIFDILMKNYKICLLLSNLKQRGHEFFIN